MDFTSEYRYLIGDSRDVDTLVHSGAPVTVAYKENVSMRLSHDGRRAVTEIIYSDLLFNLSDEQNPIVTHKGRDYHYNQNTARWEEKYASQSGTYHVLLGGGRIATALGNVSIGEKPVH